MMTKKVIIDCDPSADDAIALMLAAGSPELSVEAVTTVSGVCEAKDCAEHARQVLKLCGRAEIPVYAGAAQPLSRKLTFDGKYCGADGLSETGLPPSEIADNGVSAETALCRLFGIGQKEPEKSHIVSIAPMTNLAKLLLRFPEASAQIASIVTTNGSYGVAPDKRAWNPRPSWNVAADPEAAQIVLESGVPVIAAGLDVTMQLQNVLVEKLLREGDPQRWQYQFLERAVQFNRARGLEPFSLLVDAMAVAAAARPELLSLIRGKAAICTDDGLFCGQVLFGTAGYLDGTASDVSAAYAFDFDGFTALLLERVFG